MEEVKDMGEYLKNQYRKVVAVLIISLMATSSFVSIADGIKKYEVFGKTINEDKTLNQDKENIQKKMQRTKRT